MGLRHNYRNVYLAALTSSALYSAEEDIVRRRAALLLDVFVAAQAVVVGGSVYCDPEGTFAEVPVEAVTKLAIATAEWVLISDPKKRAPRLIRASMQLCCNVTSCHDAVGMVALAGGREFYDVEDAVDYMRSESELLATG